MKKNYILLVVAVIFIIVIFAGFFIWQNFLARQNKSQQQPIINNHKQTINQLAILETFKDEFGFQMQYPSDKKVMNVPTSKMVACNNSCPVTLMVNGVESAYTNQTINGVKYCVYSGAKTTNGTSYSDYLFLTIKNNNCYGLEISYQDSTNIALISQALSTIKFIK